MYGIILCGGSGSRLWPLSRKNFPKQFLSLYSDKSLLQETYLRARVSMPAKNIFIVTDNENSFTAINQMCAIDPEFKKSHVLIEPKRLGTAPALIYAVKYLVEIVKINLDDQIISLNSDHYVGNLEKYLKVLKNAVASNGNNIGLIGIKPTAPKTGFGYVLKGRKKGSYFEALKFMEKPKKKIAQKYFSSGKYVWNSAIYVFNAKTFIRELSIHSPKLYNRITKSYAEFIKNYKTIPLANFETTILEKSKNIAIFEGDFGWSDIGSFDALAEVIKKDTNKRHIAIDSKNIFVHSDSNRLVVTLGIEDLNIIETADSILVQKYGHSEDIKRAVEEIKRRGFREIEHNLIVHRPWGKYEILIENPTHRVKKTTLYPGAKLNIQSHQHRTEHWIIIKGIAKVKIDGKEFILHENESTFVPSLIKHGMKNYGKTNLEIIEVQTGKNLNEADTLTYNDAGKLIDQALIQKN